MMVNLFFYCQHSSEAAIYLSTDWQQLEYLQSKRHLLLIPPEYGFGQHFKTYYNQILLKQSPFNLHFTHFLFSNAIQR